MCVHSNVHSEWKAEEAENPGKEIRPPRALRWGGMYTPAAVLVPKNTNSLEVRGRERRKRTTRTRRGMPNPIVEESKIGKKEGIFRPSEGALEGGKQRDEYKLECG